jgi:hypothetical protein
VAFVEEQPDEVGERDAATGAVTGAGPSRAGIVEGLGIAGIEGLDLADARTARRAGSDTEADDQADRESARHTNGDARHAVPPLLD